MPRSKTNDFTTFWCKLVKFYTQRYKYYHKTRVDFTPLQIYFTRRPIKFTLLVIKQILLHEMYADTVKSKSYSKKVNTI